MPAAQQRFPGLDAWRGGLMLAGLLVHADLLQEHRPMFDMVGFVSAHFRMGVFMVVSGLLAGLATRRRPVAAWTGERLQRLGLPLATGWLLTAPVLAAAVASLPADGAARHVPAALSLHHLWFLAALILYVPLVAALDAADRRWRLAARIDAADVPAWRLQVALLGGTAAAAVLAMEAAVLVQHMTGGAASHAVDRLPLVFGYAPMYLLGFLLARAPRALARATRPALPLAALVGVLAAEAGFAAAGGGEAAVSVLILGMAASPVMAAALVLRSALRMRTVPEPLARVADASVTIYLLHYPLLAVINAGLSRSGAEAHAQWLLAIALAGGLTYAFHRRVIRRSALGTLLFCGRMPAPERAVRTVS